MPLNTKTFCLNCHTRRAASEFALIDAVFGDLLNLRFVSQTIRTLRPFNYCDCQSVMLGGNVLHNAYLFSRVSFCISWNRSDWCGHVIIPNPQTTV